MPLSFDVTAAMGGGSIQIFSSVQKFHQMLGVYPPNWKNVFFIICVTQLSITTLAFILISAESADEFGFAFYACITGALHCGHLSITREKIQNISELMESYDAFIDRSKSMVRVLVLVLSIHVFAKYNHPFQIF